jgi:hypothetical protein
MPAYWDPCPGNRNAVFIARQPDSQHNHSRLAGGGRRIAKFFFVAEIQSPPSRVILCEQETVALSGAAKSRR